MRFHLPGIKTLITIALVVILGIGESACSRRVYYSSKRVYNAQKEQNKRLKRKGYSNQQLRRSPSKRTKWNKKRNFDKRKHKSKGGFFKSNK